MLQIKYFNNTNSKIQILGVRDIKSIMIKFNKYYKMKINKLNKVMSINLLSY